MCVYFVSVESLDSCHSTSRGVICVCILFLLNLLILVTVLHVELTVCVYFVSVESLDSCHSTSRGVNCVFCFS